MAKSRRKSKSELDSFYTIIILALCMITYKLSGSFEIVSIAAAILIFFIIGIQILISKKKITRIKKSGIQDIDQMDGFQFEYYLNELFKSNGYSSKVTKSRGDYGADLILKKNGSTIAVQAKRYSKAVGIKAIQEIAAARGFYKADKAWVVTNNTFTKHATTLAQSLGVELIDRDKLIKLVLNMNPEATVSTEQILNTVQPKSKKCKSCGDKLIIKKGKYSRFYGCTNYPTCHYTEKL